MTRLSVILVVRLLCSNVDIPKVERLAEEGPVETIR